MTNGDVESRLWKVLEKQRLADLSQYRNEGFFDEVPLYSRSSDISFLGMLGQEGANRVLLEFALKFLNALVNYEPPQSPFFAALTIWDHAEKFIVPSIFVCNGKVKQRLRGRLILHRAETEFGRGIRKLLRNAKLTGQFQAFEDDLTVPDITRVFIGHKTVIHSQMVKMDAFLDRSHALRGTER